MKDVCMCDTECWQRRLPVAPSFWCRLGESGVIWPGSSPGVGAVLEVVVLELDLVFDLVDQNLRQEDANQLQETKQMAQQLGMSSLCSRGGDTAGGNIL